MDVNRREMLTAASAIGLTTMLSKTAVGAAENDNQLAQSNFGQLEPLGFRTAVWANVDSLSDLKKAARIVRYSGPKMFAKFKRSNLVNWLTSGPSEKRVVRGYYKIDAESKKHLRLVYAITYKENEIETKPHYDYRIYVIGGIWKGAHKKTFINGALTEIRADLAKNFFNQAAGQSEAVFNDIGPSLFTRKRSIIGRMLRWIASGRQDGFTLEKTNGPCQPVWTLTVTEP